VSRVIEGGGADYIVMRKWEEVEQAWKLNDKAREVSRRTHRDWSCL
jgi:hypothetical protein